MVFRRQMDRLKKYVPEDKLLAAVLEALIEQGISPEQISADISAGLAKVTEVERVFKEAIETKKQSEGEGLKTHSETIEQNLASKRDELKCIQGEISALEDDSRNTHEEMIALSHRLDEAEAGFQKDKQQWVFDLNADKQKLEAIAKGG